MRAAPPVDGLGTPDPFRSGATCRSRPAFSQLPGPKVLAWLLSAGFACLGAHVGLVVVASDRGSRLAFSRQARDDRALPAAEHAWPDARDFWPLLLYSIAIQSSFPFHCDPLISSCRARSILSQGLQGGDSAQACETVAASAWAVEPRERTERHGRAQLAPAHLAGHWAVWVDENWRLTFTFEGKDAVLVDYQDYH